MLNATERINNPMKKNLKQISTSPPKPPPPKIPRPAFPKSFPNVLEIAELNKSLLFLTSELFFSIFEVLRCTVNFQKEVFSLL